MKHRKLGKALKISGVVILSLFLVSRMLTLPVNWWWASTVFWGSIIGISLLIASLLKSRRHNGDQYESSNLTKEEVKEDETD